MSRRRWILFAAIFVITALILYAGLFLFGRDTGGRSDVRQVEPGSATTVKNTNVKSVKHIHLSRVINDKKQEINILEVNLAADGVRIVPALSHDLVYGYETLSAITARKKAYAAVNAGFFYDYGLPSGMVAADGRIFTLPTGKYPVFTIDEGKAALGDFKMNMWLEYAGGRSKIDKFNMPLSGVQCAVYTPLYGATNRVNGKNYTIVVKNGTVANAGVCNNETEIPDDGMVIVGDVSALSLEKKVGDKVGDVSLLSLQKGDQIKLVTDPEYSKDLQAYECGSWIVKSGNVVIGEKDAWIGVTTNNDPRTALGIKEDGTVVLMTVDGRQPGYSEGMTCSELGKFLLEYGVENAALLDGGASTEMIVEGKIVNKPSHKGQERPVGGGLVVIIDK